ncbi:MAG: four helix bundle protein [Thermoanaerobaculia bacterium]
MPTSGADTRFGRIAMNYRNLDVWEKSVQLAVVVFVTTEHISRRFGFALADQARRAALSVPSNVAESCGRSSWLDKRQFAVRARGSLYELATQVEICRRLGAIDADTLREIEKRVDSVGCLVSGLIRYYASRIPATSRKPRHRP